MCTRTMHTEKDKTITGRNFDWVDWSGAGLWIYPAGLERNGAAGDYSHTWTSLYKSVTASSYDSVTDDGLNENGLVANLLWLASSVYPVFGAEPGKKAISVSIWAQYILDLCTDVQDAIDKMKKVYVVSANVPGGGVGECHLSVSDKAGNSAIFEYIDGTLITYTNLEQEVKDKHVHVLKKKRMQVMTNEPGFNEQLMLNAYWQLVDGNVFLPGSCSPVDRFVRATYYNKRLPESSTPTEALAHVLSVMHNVVEPFEIGEGEGHASPTQYITLGEHDTNRYFFGPTKSPFMSWIDLNAFVFSADEAKNNQALNLAFQDGGALRADGKQVGGQLTKEDFEWTDAFAFIESEPQFATVD